MNKVFLIGNLGKDPVVKRTESGKAVATFSIATSETYKDKSGNKVDNTTWHNIVLWEKLAEIAEKYLKKGSKVCIVGKISNRSYEQDGVTKYISEVVCNELEMLGDKRDANTTTKNETATASTTETIVEYDYDLPF